MVPPVPKRKMRNLFFDKVVKISKSKYPKTILSKEIRSAVKTVDLVAVSQVSCVCDLVCHRCKFLGFPANNDF